MARRTTYHVTKSEDGWKGKKQGSDPASVVGNTKKEVVKKTIEVAKKQENSSVQIHKKDGKIQEERTYGNDPNPPKG